MSLGRKGRRWNRLNYTAEPLEPRHLLTDVSFAAPVSTPLPAGFIPQDVFLTRGGFVQNLVDDYIVTAPTGGGLLLHTQDDGTFTLVQHLNTPATLLEADDEPVNNDVVPTIYTTQGVMTLQPDGTYSAPTGYTLPPDAVPGAIAIDNVSMFKNNHDVLFERFIPSAGDSTHGDIILAVLPKLDDGTFGVEIDSTVETNVPAPVGPQKIDIVTLTTGPLDSFVVDGVFMSESQDYHFSPQPGWPVLSSEEKRGSVYVIPLSGSSIYNTPNSFVVFPTQTIPGSDTVEQFLNQDNGTFKQGLSVALAPAGTTAGKLFVDDITRDFVPDLMTARVSGPGSPAIVVAPGLRPGTYFKPQQIPVPGLLAVEDYNYFINSAVCLTATGTGANLHYSLVTLHNLATDGAVERLLVTPNPVIAGQSVTMVAMVSSNASDLTGPMTFYDGSTSLGASPIDPAGTAVFTTKNLSVGVHTIGIAFDQVNSQPVAQVSLTVNAPPAGPLILASAVQFKLPDVLVPGDLATARLTFTNQGSSTASDDVKVNLYASPTPALDTSAIPIPDAALDDLHLTIASNHTQTVATSFTIPDSIPPGNYYLITQLASAGKTKTTDVVTSPVVEPDPVQVAWQFGDVGKRHNVPLELHAGQATVTFTLTGKGTGTVSEGGSGLTLGPGSPDFQFIVDHTTRSTKVAATQKGASSSNILSLTLNSSVGTLDLRQDTPHLIQTTQDPANPVNIGQLLIGSLPAASAVGGGNPGTATDALVSISGSVGLFSAVKIDNGDVKLATAAATAVAGSPTPPPNIGKISGVNVGSIAAGHALISYVPIDSLKLTSAQADAQVSAPAVGRFLCTGDFDADLTLTGTASPTNVLGTLQINGRVAGNSPRNDQWALNGNVGKIRIAGAVKNLRILAGAQLGPPATFSGVRILSLQFGSTVSASQFVAGVDPTDATFGNADDQLLPGGSIGSISAKGGVSPDSLFEAASLPGSASVDGKNIATHRDSRFKSA